MGRWLSDALAGIPPVLAYLLIGVLATGDSVFVGPVLPGELALLLGGFLAFHGRVSLAVMMAVSAAGAVGGYLLGYEIGRRYGPALRTSRIGRGVGAVRWQRWSGARRPGRAGSQTRPRVRAWASECGRDLGPGRVGRLYPGARRAAGEESTAERLRRKQ